MTTNERRTDPALRAVALGALASLARDRYEAARKELADTLRRGHKAYAYDPEAPEDDDTTLGSVSVSKPVHEARCTDEQKLAEWLLDNDYESLTEVKHDVTGPADEVIEVLLAHAPHLVSERVVPQGHALADMLTASAANHTPTGPGGEADVPGITVERPAPSLTIHYGKAKDRVAELHRAGRLNDEGYLIGDTQ